MAPNSRSPDAGFLLTETLATFAISAFVMLGLASSAAVILNAIDRSVAHVQQVDDIGRTLSAITRDVSTLRRARWAGFEPQSFVFRGGPNSLFFARAERNADGTEEMRVIAFREIAAGNATQMMRSDAKLSPVATSFDDLDFGPQRVLPTGATRLRFYYVVPPEKGQDEKRALSWPPGSVLPSAVIVEAVEPGSTRLIVSARIPIRADADIGCIDSEANGNGANGNGAAGAQGAAQGGAAGAPPGAQPGVAQGAGGQYAQGQGPNAYGDQGGPGQPGSPNAQQAQNGQPGQPGANGDTAFCGRSDGGGKGSAMAAIPLPALAGAPQR